MKRKLLSVILAVLIAFSLLTPAFAVEYPSGVTEGSAAQSAQNLDRLIEKLVPMLDEGAGNLQSMVDGVLISDETLSGILTALYGAMEEYASALSILGIDISPASVAANLADYPEVSAAITAAGSFASLNLDGVSWGVSMRGGFARAVSLILTPFNDVLYMLLCSGTVNVSVIPIPGDDGYQNGIVPMLNALGYHDTISNEQFKADAAEWKGYMIENLVIMLFGLLEDILASPVTELCKRLPNLANFFKSGGFSDAVDGLLHPISIHIGDIITLVPATKLISILMFFTDTKKYTTNFTENMTTILNEALESSEIKLAEINLDELRSCGTEADGVVYANLGESFVEVMGWLLDTAKLNKDSLPDLLKENDVDISDYRSMLDSVLSKDTNALLSLIVKLMTAESGEDYDYQWVQKEFAPGTVEYTADMSEYEAARVADNIDETIDAFIKEGGEYKSLKDALKKNLFSDNLVATAAVGVYSLLGGDALNDIIGALGFDFSPSGIASHLHEGKYASAKRALQSAKSWDDIKAENLSFGVKSGNAKDFEAALIAVLRPFEPLLRALLANEAFVLLDCVHIPGSNGYNTAIIPILEALGCDSNDILSYEKYKKNADGDGVLEGILDPIVKKLNKRSKKPISGVIDILPNMLRFIDDGSLMQCLLNLLHPVLALLDETGLNLADMGFNLDELKETDLLGTISAAVPGMVKDVKLDAPDLKKLSNLGSLETRTSKATYQGSNYSYSYEVSDRAAVALTILRYVMSLLEKEENADLITGFMGGGSATNKGSSSDAGGNMFDQYAGDFGSMFEGKSTDENLAFLYRLFFHERVTEETTVNDYSPTIIYEKEDKFEVNTAALVTAIFIILVFGMLAIINRKRITYTVSAFRKRKQEKAANGREVK